MRPKYFPRLHLAVGGLTAAMLACHILDIGVEQYFLVTKTEDTDDGVCSEADCSLREAVDAANTRPGLDHIQIPAGTYVLGPADEGGGSLDLYDAVTIEGRGADLTIIEGSGDRRIFSVQGRAVELTDLTIQNGAGDWQGGGCVLNLTGTLTLNDVVIRDCSSHQGGGLLNLGTLTVNGGQIRENMATTAGGGLFNSGGTVSLNGTQLSANSAGSGGAIYNNHDSFPPRDGSRESIMSISGAYIAGNVAQAQGGGIYNDQGAQLSMSSTQISGLFAGLHSINAGQGGGVYNSGDLNAEGLLFYNLYAIDGGGLYNFMSATVVISNSIFALNNADMDGGAILNFGDLSLTESTVHDNSALRDGGGVISSNYLILINSTINANSASSSGGGLVVSSATITNSTISDNTAPLGAGLRVAGGTAQLLNTIVAGNIGGGCTGSSIVSLGHNLESGNTCGFIGAGDRIDTDPLLDPIQWLGPAFMRSLQATSPAIDAGDSAGCPPIDQRGGLRPFGAACDIGAYEFGATPGVPHAAPPTFEVPTIMVASSATSTAQLPPPVLPTWTRTLQPTLVEPSDTPEPTATPTTGLIIVTIGPLLPSSTPVP